MLPRRTTRHDKPVFEVVSDAVEDSRTGWVYRSDAVRAAQPAAHAPASAAPPRFIPSAPAPPRSAGTPRRLGATTPRTAAPPPAARSSFGWVAGAVTMMTLPIVITAGMMIAPIALVWAARKSTNG